MPYTVAAPNAFLSQRRGTAPRDICFLSAARRTNVLIINFRRRGYAASFGLHSLSVHYSLEPILSEVRYTVKVYRGILSVSIVLLFIYISCTVRFLVHVIILVLCSVVLRLVVNIYCMLLLHIILSYTYVFFACPLVRFVFLTFSFFPSMQCLEALVFEGEVV